MSSTIRRLAGLAAAVLLAAAAAAGCGGAGAAHDASASPSASPIQRATIGGLRVITAPGAAVQRFALRIGGAPGPVFVSYTVTDAWSRTVQEVRDKPLRHGAQDLTWSDHTAKGPALPGVYYLTVRVRGATGTPVVAPRLAFRIVHPVRPTVWRRVPGAGNRVALTFDDGGGRSSWYWILHYLVKAHVKGTFFPIGVYVDGYARRMAHLTLLDGMAIGSHSWSHPDLLKLKDKGVRWQLQRAEDVWWHYFKTSTLPYLRPPYGHYNARTLAIAGRLGYARIILWDVDSNDYENPGVKAIVRTVLSHARPGSIILLHTRRQTPLALPAIIRGLKARHLQMVTIPELFRAAGLQ